MAPTAPPPIPRSNPVTLQALTQRLSQHALHPLIGSSYATSLSPAASTSTNPRQPVPPPVLPAVPLYSRHQDPPRDAKNSGTGEIIGDGFLRCPKKRMWAEPQDHSKSRSTRMAEKELDDFIADMGVIMRREFDCWVEQCWTEAFHHLFTRAIPTLLIQLIIAGATPQFLRRQIVHGGAQLDLVFLQHMQRLLYTELEHRLSGDKASSERGPSSASGSNSKPISQALPPPLAQLFMPEEVGVCFHALCYNHDPEMEEDDHGICLCHLTTCTSCFHAFTIARRGAFSPLPHNLAYSSVASGWNGPIETEAQARARAESLNPPGPTPSPIPTGKGFVLHQKTPAKVPKPVPLFPHPQMTDVLAVEEHLRWRLKELGGTDPAVEARYGPCKNSPSAIDGVELPDDPVSEEGESPASVPPGKNGGVGAGAAAGAGPPKIIKTAKGKGGKVRQVVNGGGHGATGKKDAKQDAKKEGKVCYLPKQWVEANPQERNTAIVLTFRHFVKLLHQVTAASSPFSYAAYETDINDLSSVHPIALYRRLAEMSMHRHTSGRELRSWQECMDKWGDELGGKERALGNKLIGEDRCTEAVDAYTRAISLDPKKTVYYTNRAVALNRLAQHARAEADCKYIITKDVKNSKAYYQRALAREGLGKWREAEADAKECLKYAVGGLDAAKVLLARVKVEVAKLPKQSVEDAMNF